MMNIFFNLEVHTFAKQQKFKQIYKMNSSNENYLSCRQSIYQEDGTIEKEVDSFNRETYRIEKIKIQIKFTSDQKIVYSQNKAILRVIECHDAKGKKELFNNMDQIHNLLWEGQYQQNKTKEGKWIAFWNKKLLKNVGGYYKAGLKHGLWKDLFLNYSDQAQIFELGEYSDGQKIGRWDYIKKNKKIGGGNYNQNGVKYGKWIELDEGFYSQKKVVYMGEYNMNGVKVGSWDIMLKNELEKGYQQIGGGLYDQEGNQKKIGKWTELDEEFYGYNKFTHNGEYNINDGKLYLFNIENSNKCKYYLYEYLNIYSGGGLYDQEGNQKKIGKWTELDEEFYGYNKFTHNGEYNMNGMKVGRWDIISNQYGEYKQIGGGSYDQEGNQKKIGKWVELDERFDNQKKVTYIGEYSMNGMKVGRWDIMFKDDYENNYQESQYENINHEKHTQEYKQMQTLDNYQTYLVVVDNMINMEIRKSQVSGQNWMKGSIV
ncbi:unnamed protein product [Paramecium sonneborni]|uniref:MORN repeat protein n=1 Tax=Paramecium sonneborni TaxID=65129 RepID=A0A8S1PXE5_9CILI|nr:unnamed protein product [Paramecium sonneborni]